MATAKKNTTFYSFNDIFLAVLKPKIVTKFWVLVDSKKFWVELYDFQILKECKFYTGFGICSSIEP